MRKIIGKLCRRRKHSKEKKTSLKVPSPAAGIFLQRLEHGPNRKNATNSAIEMVGCILAKESIENRRRNNNNSNTVAAEFDFDHLIQVLQSNNNTLQRLHISGTFLATFSVMEQHLFWQILARNQDKHEEEDTAAWPNLQFLSFSDFGSDFPLPVSVLTRLLKNKSRNMNDAVENNCGIRQLDLSHVRFKGDWNQLGETLQSHSSLQTIQTWDVDLVGGGSTSQQQVLQILLNIRHLRLLSLGGFSFHKEQVEEIATTLSHKEHQLKCLRLQGGCSNSQNQNNLQEPNEHDQPFPSSPHVQATPLDNESCMALAGMLQVNQSLEKLELSNLQIVNHPNRNAQTNNTSSGLVALARALQHHNRTLKSFHLFQLDLFCRHDMTIEENNALVQMLQENQVIESFLPQGTGPAHDQVEFYLKCNHEQLYGIHVDVNYSRSEFVERIASVNLSNDIDCIYHLLRDNSSIVAIDGQ